MGHLTLSSAGGEAGKRVPRGTLTLTDEMHTGAIRCSAARRTHAASTHSGSTIPVGPAKAAGCLSTAAPLSATPKPPAAGTTPSAGEGIVALKGSSHRVDDFEPMAGTPTVGVPTTGAPTHVVVTLALRVDRSRDAGVFRSLSSSPWLKSTSRPMPTVLRCGSFPAFIATAKSVPNV